MCYPVGRTLASSLVALVLAACATPAAAPTATAEAASVCDVLDRVDVYAGQATTTLSGRVVTDFTHRTAMGDDRCPGRLLPFGQSQPDTIGRQAFFNAVHGARATPDAIISVTVMGNVEQRLDQGPNVVFNAREFVRITVTNGGVVTDYPIEPPSPAQSLGHEGQHQ